MDGDNLTTSTSQGAAPSPSGAPATQPPPQGLPQSQPQQQPMQQQAPQPNQELGWYQGLINRLLPQETSQPTPQAPATQSQQPLGGSPTQDGRQSSAPSTGLSEAEQQILDAYREQGASIEDVNRTLIEQQTQLQAYQALPADIAQAPGVMDALMQDPGALQAMINNPQAREAFVNTYYKEAGYQGGYDGPAPTGYSGGTQRPGQAFEAISGPVMPETMQNLLQQPPSFFQELALVDDFDPRQFGGY